MEEIWKDIEGYEGYRVSSEGRVKSNDFILTHRSGKKYKREGKILTPITTHNGYLRVGLGGCKSQKRFFVHRLVYEAFVGPIPEGMQVNHINEIKTDNRPENLNLMTPKENNNWGTKIKRTAKKNKNPVTQYLLDGTPYFSYFSATDAETDLGISNGNINKCCNNKRETAGGYKWKYAKQ